MARQAASPWGKDYKVMTRNENIAPRDFRLEVPETVTETVDGVEVSRVVNRAVSLEEYQRHQRERALAMREAARKAKR